MGDRWREREELQREQAINEYETDGRGEGEGLLGGTASRRSEGET